ncbi:XAP5, circadian clock regulator-domain-containing protein [Calycina marina]|uniref:XAP5, circadian clock regulator-domain-containing protein n=1 Tax=Calycina marina TaxID=1763456 RepID=A0A9P7Z4M9_9HELO|nr:XAP5, circadian clock regulator-domain-containing protein [Calycina marina]
MSNTTSGSSTPNPRFTLQTKTAEDLLKNQTVGLVALSDYRKRRAEAIEQKERDTHDALLGGGLSSGRATPGNETPDGASIPKEPVKKKKKRKTGAAKLSFGIDDEEGESTGVATPKDSIASSPAGTPGGKDPPVRKKVANASVVAPKALTKSAMLKELETREALRKDFLVLQEAVKETEVNIPFVFYDGTNIPGGVCKIKKGDFVWVFLDRSRKVGAELGVGEEKVNSRREWARIGIDDLMMVRGSIIIPHHYDFYYFIVNRTKGPNEQTLFDYSSEPSSSAASSDLSNNGPRYIEGTDDDTTFTKVVDRRWYERNKHIYPASVWQDFDPEKDYRKEVKRDAGGNAFFFS